jgi:hypothetical protein
MQKGILLNKLQFICFRLLGKPDDFDGATIVKDLMDVPGETWLPAAITITAYVTQE